MQVPLLLVVDLTGETRVDFLNLKQTQKVMDVIVNIEF